jgi:hypothetical protein
MHTAASRTISRAILPAVRLLRQQLSGNHPLHESQEFTNEHMPPITEGAANRMPSTRVYQQLTRTTPRDSLLQLKMCTQAQHILLTTPSSNPAKTCSRNPIQHQAPTIPTPPVSSSMHIDHVPPICHPYSTQELMDPNSPPSCNPMQHTNTHIPSISHAAAIPKELCMHIPTLYLSHRTYSSFPHPPTEKMFTHMYLPFISQTASSPQPRAPRIRNNIQSHHVPPIYFSQQQSKE